MCQLTLAKHFQLSPAVSSPANIARETYSVQSCDVHSYTSMPGLRIRKFSHLPGRTCHVCLYKLTVRSFLLHWFIRKLKLASSKYSKKTHLATLRSEEPKSYPNCALSQNRTMRKDLSSISPVKPYSSTHPKIHKLHLSPDNAPDTKFTVSDVANWLALENNLWWSRSHNERRGCGIEHFVTAHWHFKRWKKPVRGWMCNVFGCGHGVSNLILLCLDCCLLECILKERERNDRWLNLCLSLQPDIMLHINCCFKIGPLDILGAELCVVIRLSHFARYVVDDMTG